MIFCALTNVYVLSSAMPPLSAAVKSTSNFIPAPRVKTFLKSSTGSFSLPKLFIFRLFFMRLSGSKPSFCAPLTSKFSTSNLPSPKSTSLAKGVSLPFITSSFSLVAPPPTLSRLSLSMTILLSNLTSLTSKFLLSISWRYFKPSS